jgi:hypothetical protein
VAAAAARGEWRQRLPTIIQHAAARAGEPVEHKRPRPSGRHTSLKPDVNFGGRGHDYGSSIEVESWLADRMN